MRHDYKGHGLFRRLLNNLSRLSVQYTSNGEYSGNGEHYQGRNIGYYFERSGVYIKKAMLEYHSGLSDEDKARVEKRIQDFEDESVGQYKNPKQTSLELETG